MAKTLKYTNKMLAEYRNNVIEEFKNLILELDKTPQKYKEGVRYTSLFKETKQTVEKQKVYITSKAYAKMLQYVTQSHLEIAWHGTVEHPEENVYKITDVMLYPQTVTAATVTTDQKEYETWLDNLEDEVFNKIRFQGHSHVNMAVNPSGVDLEYYNDLTNALSTNTFYIFLIMNKKQDFYIEIRDLANNTYYEKEDIELIVLDENNENLLSDVEFEIKQNTKLPEIATPKYKPIPWRGDYIEQQWHKNKYFADDFEDDELTRLDAWAEKTIKRKNK